MNDGFKEYLLDFFKNSKIDPKGISFDNVIDFESMWKQFYIADVNLCYIPYLIFRANLKYIFTLHENGIHLYDPDYKLTPQYLSIKDDWIDSAPFSVENYIEHFLLDTSARLDIYALESIYTMGNPYKLNAAECTDEALSKEIMISLEPYPDIKSCDISAKIPEFIIRIYREGGVVDRLKKDLDLDIELFVEKGYKAESCKIIYFLYELIYKLIPELLGENDKGFKLFRFLRNPSMESADYSLFGWNTFNGGITRLIKNRLEKEMSFKNIAIIQDALESVANVWNSLCFSASAGIELSIEQNLDQKIYMLETMLDDPYKSFVKPILDLPPIATFYLKISQFERLGEIKDAMLVNNLKITSDYHVPVEYIKKMKLIKDKYIDIGRIEEYIKDNIYDIAEHVYLTKDLTKSKLGRIERNILKVRMVVDCCNREHFQKNRRNDVSVLLIISIFQAILHDKENRFDYSFFGYEKYTNSHHKPSTSLKENEHLVNAAKLYWARKTYDYRNANLGEYKLRNKHREYRYKLSEVLSKVYSCSDFTAMLDTSEYYYCKFSGIEKPMHEEQK